MTQLTDHFSLAEMTFTEHRGIDNSCPPELLPNLLGIATLMEKVRAALCDKMGTDVEIHVTSGYRCPELNAAIGGAAHSDHVRALACDFKATQFGSPYLVAQYLATQVDALGIGQLIHEFGSWVHVSARQPDKQVNRIITYRVAGLAEVGIQPVTA